VRVGLIFECGTLIRNKFGREVGGADIQVCEYLIRKFLPDVRIVKSVGLDNKPNLLRNCGEEAKAMLEIAHCDRVIIIWDLHPAWRIKNARPCRKEDKEIIQESLTNAGLTSKEVHLVCIEEELEDWLIMDGQILSSLLSKPTHPGKRIPDRKRPSDRLDPKTALIQLFKERGFSDGYVDRDDAIRIVQRIERFDKHMNNCETFKRFMEKVSGKTYSRQKRALL
jgi:hypothetical protein